MCCPQVKTLNVEQHCFSRNESSALTLSSRATMSRFVGVRSVQRSPLRCDAALNSRWRMSTCWTVSSEGVKVEFLPLISGFELGSCWVLGVIIVK